MVTEVILPKLGQTMEEGTIVEWLKQEGEPIQRGEVLFMVETDKATLEVEASARGFLRKILVPVGQTVSVLTVVALITRKADEDISAYEPQFRVASARFQVDEAAQPAALEPETRIFASPRARRLAREKGVDLALVTGSGPNDRIVERDVLAYLERRQRPEPVEGPKATPTAVKAAEALGIQADLESFRTEYADFKECLFRSIDRACTRDGVDHIPGGPYFTKLRSYMERNLTLMLYPGKLMDPHDPMVTTSLKKIKSNLFCKGLVYHHWPAYRERYHWTVLTFEFGWTHLLRGERAEAIETLETMARCATPTRSWSTF